MWTIHISYIPAPAVFWEFFLKPRIWVEMKGTDRVVRASGASSWSCNNTSMVRFKACGPNPKNAGNFSKRGHLCISTSVAFFFIYPKAWKLCSWDASTSQKKWPCLLESNFPQGPIGDQICWKRFQSLDSGQVGFDHSRSLRKPTVDSKRMVKGLKTTTASVLGWKHPKEVLNAW